MASDKPTNPFQTSPEKELHGRFKSAKKLTRKEFAKRVKESREERLKEK